MTRWPLADSCAAAIDSLFNYLVGKLLLFKQAKHCSGYHVFRGGVQDGPLKLTAGVGTMLLAAGDNSPESIPDAVWSAIHRATAVAEGRRHWSRLCGRAQLPPNMLKLFKLNFG
jgi:hypothetical protein